MPQLVIRFMTVKSNKEINRGVIIRGIFMLAMAGIAYVVGSLSNVFFLQTQGKISIAVAGGNADSIIPIYINTFMPEWFVYIFLLTLLAAAMSTSSSQFHVQGIAIGRDVYETLTGKKGKSSVLISRIGITLAVLIAVSLGYILPGNIIGRDFLITQMPWPVVDPIMVAFPLAILITIVVSLMTKPPSQEQLNECFKGIN